MQWYEKIPWERIILGIAIIWGFVAIITYMLGQEIPAGNKEIILSMTAVLGTALGAVVNSIFRSSNSDEAKNRTIETLANTAAAPLTTTTTETVTNGQPESGAGAGRSRSVAAGNTDAGADPIPARVDDDFPDEPPSVDGLGEETQPGR